MAFDAYIQIAHINGEALDAQYPNWIEITGYKFGARDRFSRLRCLGWRYSGDRWG